MTADPGTSPVDGEGRVLRSIEQFHEAYFPETCRLMRYLRVTFEEATQIRLRDAMRSSPEGHRTDG